MDYAATICGYITALAQTAFKYKSFLEDENAPTCFAPNILTRILFCRHEYLKAGKSYKYVLPAPHNIGDIQRVDLKWIHKPNLLNPLEWNLLRHPKVFFQKVVVTVGESSKQ